MPRVLGGIEARQLGMKLT